MKAFPELQKSVMYKAIRTKNIKLNGRRCEISTRLKAGDELKIFINDELLGNQKTEKKQVFRSGAVLKKEDIIYEDENIIVLNKKPGVIVHSDSKNEGDTLADRLKNYLVKHGEYDPASENSFAPALCNRLDRNTAGIVIGAKNAAALREINKKIRENNVVKKYLIRLPPFNMCVVRPGPKYNHEYSVGVNPMFFCFQVQYAENSDNKAHILK